MKLVFWLLWWLLQDENLTKQLNAGVRYFDLRIARKPNDPNPTRLYFYHGLYTHTTVEVKEIMLKKKKGRSCIAEVLVSQI